MSRRSGMSGQVLAWFAVALLTLVSTVTGIPQDGECRDCGMEFERAFARPGEAAMLQCFLVDLLDSTHPYNLTWYHLHSGQEVRAQAGRTIVWGRTLWFLNITEEDGGEFMCVVSTAEGCFKKVSVLMVDVGPGAWPEKGCVRKSIRSGQFLDALTNGIISCPVPWDQLSLLTDSSYSIQWYKGCEVLQLGGKFLQVSDTPLLRVIDVAPDDADNYTCVLSFQFRGVKGHMVETIDIEVNEDVTYQPHILLPKGEISKVYLGSTVRKVCLVWVPGAGELDVFDVFVMWRHPKNNINYNSTERIHQLVQSQQPKEWKGQKGVYLEAELVLTDVREEDLNVNFTCEVHSGRRFQWGSFTLQLDSNLLLPLGLVFGGVALLFVECVVLYRLYKIEIALFCRDIMPYLYPSTEGDGKLYDAYVVYPRETGQWGGAEEAFALSTIPTMLEGRYGYRLFILGRDCMPGEALVDVVYSALSLSRRVLLLYGGRSQSCGGVVDWGAWLEQQLALQLSLLEDETLGVVLIDLGGVSDSALPPALRLLKEEQGALSPTHNAPPICCRTWGGGGDEQEGEELASINPSPRFWRGLRYHMPIRGKARPRPCKHTPSHTLTHTLTHTHNHTQLLTELPQA